MEIRVLRYFLAVAREGNITRAARFLHITQPTLSRQLIQLEEELETQLFIRKNNRIILTEEGMLLRRRAEEIIDLSDKTQREFLDYNDMMSGEVFIGAGETDAMNLLADVISEFRKKYPLVKYHLYSGNADDIHERIDKGLIDIGLLTEPVDITKYEFIRLKQKEVWGIIAPKDSLLSKKTYITPQDLLSLPIIVSRRSLVQHELAHWIGKDFDQLNVIATYNLIYNAAIMVEKGIGYAICLEKLIDVSELSHVCFIPFLPKLETGTVIVWKKNQMFSRTTSYFIEQMKQILDENRT